MPKATESSTVPGSYGGRSLLFPTGVVLLLAGAAVVVTDRVVLASNGPAPPASARPQTHLAPAPAAAPAATKPSVAGAAELAEPLRAAVDHFLTAPITLTFDGRSIATSWKELGIVRDDAGLERLAAELATAGTKAVAPDFFSAATHTAPVLLDRKKGLEAVVALKDSYDRPANDARVDLINRKVLPEQRGFGVQVYESLAALEEAARAGAKTLALIGGEVEPAVTLAKLGNLEIGNVMGWFETHYPPGERDRNYNLRLAAEHVNGHIIMPGETFAFNEVVGDRTEKQGYRVAHVIQAGEMIDGLAGGACQISSTLHGASWFAGLDIVYSRPHSRPSAYVTMGMDATVVYPTTDLKLRNPYEFPVVIHYVVSQGTVRVEILGQARPWDKVAFEREIKKETPYETVTREDDSMPVGSSLVEQVGFPGYNLVRRRLFYKNGEVAKVEKWDIAYPPTTEYVRIGTNPDPNLAPPKKSEAKGLPSPGGKTYHTEQ